MKTNQRYLIPEIPNCVLVVERTTAHRVYFAYERPNGNLWRSEDPRDRHIGRSIFASMVQAGQYVLLS